MGRALSTVFDAALACLLVTASATLLVAVPGQPASPPDADRVGRALLPTTVTTSVDGHQVHASVATRLVAGATTGHVENASAMTTALARLSRRAHVTAGPPSDPARVSLGHAPPPAASAVDAAEFRLGGQPPVVVTVRTWSP